MIEIRLAGIDDADVLSALVRELGYDLTSAQVVERLRLLASSSDDHVLVAVEEGVLLGCIAIHIAELFHAPGAYGRISALVVAQSARRRGAGRKLWQHALERFQARGCLKVEVTSGAQRSEAHAFYESLGFVEVRRRYVHTIAT